MSTPAHLHPDRHPPDGWRVLVVAKAPVAGRAKTRLGAVVGLEAAAEVAAAALLDTLRAATDAVGPDRCHLALDGDLRDAVRGSELLDATTGWSVLAQRGATFGRRLAAAHADVAAWGHGDVVQVGMDTPQVTPAMLAEVAVGLGEHDAVLGPAEDGGWWVLGLREPARAAALADVAMSTSTTHDGTRAALVSAGLDVGTAKALRDVDELPDAEAVARLVPGSEFARTWAATTAGMGRSAT